MNKKNVFRAETKSVWRSLLLCQTLALAVSPLLPLSAMAQTAPVAAATSRDSVGSTTILPTDIVPLADRDAFKTPMSELLQLKIMQRLPSRLYFSSSIELTTRAETNPFQFPTKRALMAQLPRPAVWRQLNYVQQASLYDIVGQCGRFNQVFRSLPNVSGGWTIGPHTRLFTNYFMIRDQLGHSMQLNTVIHSYAVGLQQDMAIGSKGSLQFEFQGRELWQLHQNPVFDFLPGITFSYILNPRSVLFVNALLQARGTGPLIAPTRELDPFYTWGGLYQKNGWTFTASTTFVQNFREPFHHAASIPKNSYVLISDFEIARRIVKQYPGLQAFVRAEPIWNFHSHNTPSLAGMDFRMFFGMRFAMAKPALTATLQQIREQLQQESEPAPGAPGKPSAQGIPDNAITINPQPIHGFLEADTFAETCKNPNGDMPLIADSEDGSQSEFESESAQADNNKSIASAEPAADSQPTLSNAGASPDTAKPTSDSSAPTRTLEEIAAATAPEASQSGSSSSIIDISNSEINWEEIANSEPAGLTAVDKGDLHAIVQDASAASNSKVLQERSQKIQELAQKQEAEYRVAFAPAPLAVPQTALKALPAPKAQTLLPLPEPSPMPLTSLSKPAAKQTLEPQTKSASTISSLLPAPQALDITTGKHVLKPLNPTQANKTLLGANLAPAPINKEKHLLEPVGISSTVKSAANVVPTPVGARPVTLSNVLPETKSSSKVSEERAPVQHVANKDGSIPISEAKLDKATAPKFEAMTLASANVPRVNTPLLKPESPKPLQNTYSSSPTAAVPSLQSNLKTSLVNPLTSPQLSQKVQAGAKLQASLPGAKISLQKPALPEPAPQVSIAVSELGDNDISSPKIAMALYEGWQSPVIDDPLIGTGSRDNSYQSTVITVSAPGAAAAQSKAKSKAHTEKNPTDMHLIPPFPSANPSSKDNPLKDLKLPVLPVR